MELSQQCLALNANGLTTSVSLTVLHLNEIGRRSVGMKPMNDSYGRQFCLGLSRVTTVAEPCAKCDSHICSIYDI